MKSLLVGTYKFRAKGPSRFNDEAPETWGHAFFIDGEESDKTDRDGNPIHWINCYVENESWHKDIKPDQQFLLIKQKKTGKNAEGYTYRVVEPSEDVVSFFSGSQPSQATAPSTAGPAPTPKKNGLDVERAKSFWMWFTTGEAVNSTPALQSLKVLQNLDVIKAKTVPQFQEIFADIGNIICRFSNILNVLDDDDCE